MSTRTHSLPKAALGALLLSTACASPAPPREAPRPLPSVAAAAQAQEPEDREATAPPEQGDLAAEARDPTASVTALQVRIDHIADFHGLDDANQTNLVLQPIIPWKLGGHPHIARITVPFVLNGPDWGSLAEDEEPIRLPPNFTPTSDQGGLADTAALDLFLFDTSWGRWGVGPAVVLPTATDPALGSEKLSVGPAAVGIYKTGNLQVGVLTQVLFSVAGASDREDVRVMGIQPFASYGLSGGWSVGLSELNYNYDFDYGGWTSVPLGGRIEKLVKLGSLPTRIYGDVEYNFVDDQVAPAWTFRLAFVPLL